VLKVYVGSPNNTPGSTPGDTSDADYAGSNDSYAGSDNAAGAVDAGGTIDDSICLSENMFLRSPHREAIIEVLATAPAEGVPIAVIVGIPGVGSRDNADHLLSRMVKAGEIVRVGRGRYGLPGPVPAVPALHDAPSITLDRGASPVAPIPAAPWSGASGVSHRAKESSQPARDAAAPKPRTVVRDAGEMRDLFRHRRGLDPFSEALSHDEDRGPRAATADRIDLHEFVGRIGCLYGRHRLCPPFRLRDFVRSWFNDGITPELCLAVVDRHLQEHATSCRSGSGDRLMPHLDKVIRFEWNRAHPTRRAELERSEKPRPGNSLDEYTTRSRAPRILDDRVGSTAEADWEGDY
jgi:hypothetical protein